MGFDIFIGLFIGFIFIGIPVIFFTLALRHGKKVNPYPMCDYPQKAEEDDSIIAVASNNPMSSSNPTSWWHSAV
ncbi:MAG: hypothetical protein ACYCSB_02180 [bacterium]